MTDYNDIKDNEIRIIGNAEQSTTPLHKPFYRKWWFWAILVVICLLTAWVILAQRSFERHRNLALECSSTTSAPVSPTIVQTEPATVLLRDTSVNDVPLRLYTPVNAVPELRIGYPDPKDNTLVLAFQAADIRADNHEILGAFVLNGEMLSRGHSKRGFCAIINGKIQLGKAESTSLMEEATEKEGFFFRQYPLVMDSKMVENKPKGKAVRRALCEWNGTIVTVSSMEKESFHDFAQALADMGVQNAIYLVGADAYGFCHTQSDGKPETMTWGESKNGKIYEKVNFIVWRAK